MHKSEFVQENEMHKIHRNLKYKEITQSQPESLTKMQINKKKITCHLVDFAVLVNHTVKMKESKKLDKYLDFAKEIK